MPPSLHPPPPHSPLLFANAMCTCTTLAEKIIINYFVFCIKETRDYFPYANKWLVSPVPLRVEKPINSANNQ